VTKSSRQPTSHRNRRAEAADDIGITRKLRAAALTATQCDRYFRALGAQCTRFGYKASALRAECAEVMVKLCHWRCVHRVNVTFDKFDNW